MKRWISQENKPNILLFNRYVPQHIYLSKLDANIFILETNSNESNIFCSDNNGFYKLIRGKIPINMDFILVFDDEDLYAANNIKLSMNNNPLIICSHDKTLLRSGDINVFSDKILENVAINKKYSNIVYINKCVDKKLFNQAEVNRDESILTFSPRFIKSKINIKEWSKNTVLPQSFEHRRLLYSECRVYLDNSQIVTYEMLEAMSCNCPTISRANNSIICHGINGYIYNNEEEIIKIHKLLLNNNFFSHIAGYCCQSINQEDYLVEDFINNWNKLLKQIKETL